MGDVGQTRQLCTAHSILLSISLYIQCVSLELYLWRTSQSDWIERCLPESAVSTQECI